MISSWKNAVLFSERRNELCRDTQEEETDLEDSWCGSNIREGRGDRSRSARRERELRKQTLKIEGRISGSLEATSILRRGVLLGTPRAAIAPADEGEDGHRLQLNLVSLCLVPLRKKEKKQLGPKEEEEEEPNPNTHLHKYFVFVFVFLSPSVKKEMAQTLMYLVSCKLLLISSSGKPTQVSSQAMLWST